MQNLNIYLEKMISEQITEKSLDEALDLLQMVPEIQNNWMIPLLHRRTGKN